jgi:hypothetical protein
MERCWLYWLSLVVVADRRAAKREAWCWGCARCDSCGLLAFGVAGLGAARRRAGWWVTYYL